MLEAMSRLNFHSVGPIDPDTDVTERHRRKHVRWAPIIGLVVVLGLLTAGGRILQQVQAAKVVPTVVDVDWQLSEARRFGQRVIVYFTDPDDAESQRMDDAWSDTTVADLVDRHYRFVRLGPSATNYRDTLERYQFDGAPAIVVMSSSGMVLNDRIGMAMRHAGAMDADELARMLDPTVPAPQPRRGAYDRRLK